MTGDSGHHGSVGADFADPPDGHDPVGRYQGSGFAPGADGPEVLVPGVGHHPVQEPRFHQHW